MIKFFFIFLQLTIKDSSKQRSNNDEVDSIEKDFGSLVGNEAFADIKFKVDGCEIPAHKAFLAGKFQ